MAGSLSKAVRDHQGDGVYRQPLAPGDGRANANPGGRRHGLHLLASVGGVIPVFGGVQMYWTAEAQTRTETELQFKMMEL